MSSNGGSLEHMATQKTPRIDPLTLEVVDLIGTVVARYHEEYEDAAAEHALTGAQARLLSLLSLEPLPMRRLAQKLKCEPSNVTGIVDRLEARGLAERRPDPADRRVKLAAVTEEGWGVARSLRDSLRFAREPLAGLSREERVALRGLLLRMLSGSAGVDGSDSGQGGGSARPSSGSPARARARAVGLALGLGRA